MSVYKVSVEVLPMKGTTLPPDWIGAFVNVYIDAPNIIEAIMTTEATLLSDYYKPDNTYSAYKIDIDGLDEFKGSDDNDEISTENIKSLKMDGGIVYGAFHGFKVD